MRVAILALLGATVSAALPAPDEFAGFPIGSDGNLLRWERIVEYFELIADDSDRVQVDELGKTTNGNPFILTTISSPENLARLDEIRAVQRRIATQPDELSDAEIEDLAWSSPAVVLVTCSIHASEVGATQMSVELLHRMATEDSRWMRRILDNVVFLLVPSFNPDGQIIVTDWNNRIRGTDNVWAPLPWLYHPYVGHDNNRDAFMMTQVEGRYVNKILYQDWFPQVYLDEHQQNNRGMRVFAPPFRNPINPNVDPSIWALAGRFGFAMYQSLHEAGFTGVGYDRSYTAWWQGGFLRGAWFHNQVGLLTEVASANLASPVQQERSKLGKPVQDAPSRSSWLDKREEDPNLPSPPPTDVMPRFDYPRPWLGGKWTLRDIIDSELALTTALLESAADNRYRLIKTQIRMGRDAVEQGKASDPYAFVIRADQRDPGAVYRLLELLHFAGVEVHRATERFSAGPRVYPPGTYVILMGQPFRAYAKDLLEPQEHPNPSDMPAGKMGDQPYDVTAWTLPLQMEVEANPVKVRFDAKLEELTAIPQPQGTVSGNGEWLRIAAGPNSRSTAINRFLNDGAEVRMASDVLWVQGGYDATIEELGLTAARSDLADGSKRLAARRTALYRPWTASIDEGWTRWLLEQHEFRPLPLLDSDIRQGGLDKHWDVILLPGDRDDDRIVRGNYRNSTPEEFRGGIGEDGRTAIREFVSSGGTLVVWGDSVEFALKTFELPLRDALKSLPKSEFSCPGSLLRVQIDSQHPVAHGMPREASIVFRNDAAFDPLPGFSFTDLKVIARYPSADILQSGWIRGAEHLANRIAAAEVQYEKGRVILFGFRPQFRAQPHGTFKLLFNAIQSAGANL